MTRQQTGMRAEPGALKKLREILPAHIPRGYVLEIFPGLYRQTLDRLRGQFGAGELSAIIDVSNGLFLSPQMAGQHLDVQIADSGPDRLGEKWDIDLADLAKRIEGLSPFESACLELWAQNYWARHESVTFEDWVAQLIK